MKNKTLLKFVSAVILMVLLSGCCAGNSITTTGETNNTEVTNTNNKKIETQVTTETVPGVKQSAEIFVGSEDNFSKDTVYHDYIADVTENSVIVVLSVNEAVDNFRFLSLEYNDIDEDGNPCYNTRELYSIDKFTPEKPFRVKMTMFGTIPSYGVSYEDTDGNLKTFSIQQSGRDDTLILDEIE